MQEYFDLLLLSLLNSSGNHGMKGIISETRKFDSLNKHAQAPDFKPIEMADTHMPSPPYLTSKPSIMEEQRRDKRT